ncbi:acetyl-CoA hydrolase/transferase family protein [bacterium]|jgi:acetyl-CoA hydrolase|nr:acetyl-CoA hydrolase/transferase family protein [bacterium]
MGWKKEYRAKIVTAQEAVADIKSEQRVYFGAGCAVPHDLIDALVSRAEELTNVEVIHIMTVGQANYVNPEMEGHFRCKALFVGHNVRSAVNEGRADYVPIHLHQMPELLRTEIKPDVALVQVSPPDEHGFCSFGIEVGITRPAALASTKIIAEVNRRMPRTLGNGFIHVSKLDACIEVDRPLDTYSPGSLTDIEKTIGKHVAGLIDDGACLQLGIGGIPDAVLDFLHDRKDIGIHTEMFSDGLLELMDRGVVTGDRKTFHPGKIIAGFTIGSEKLYDYIHDNALIEFHPSDYVNDPFNIARNDNMVAINSALQVDLTGQVCADSIGAYIYSGFGGQVDFMRGAAMSKGGIPVTAMPATAVGGEVSRIVPMLNEGAGVVTSRADVHYVVTEYGVAQLHGKCVRDRAKALVEIAAPQFQESLLRAAHKRRLFGPLI